MGIACAALEFVDGACELMLRHAVGDELAYLVIEYGERTVDYAPGIAAQAACYGECSGILAADD